MGRLETVSARIDAANAADPVRVSFEGDAHPQALIEGRRAHEWVLRLQPDAAYALQLAARAHHIRRWEVPRADYPRGRTGYLRWRTKLYGFHADIVAELMGEAGYAEDEIDVARRVIHKRGIKTDANAQTYEDAVSLAFLEIRLAAFVPTVPDAALLNALRRTWRKMSEPGREAALALDLPEAARLAVERALE